MLVSLERVFRTTILIATTRTAKLTFKSKKKDYVSTFSRYASSLWPITDDIENTMNLSKLKQIHVADGKRGKMSVSEFVWFWFYFSLIGSESNASFLSQSLSVVKAKSKQMYFRHK